MAFVVEDGSGLPDATSFTSVAFFTDYCTDRGYLAAAWDTPRIQKNLIQASDYFQAKYSLAVSGFPVSLQQALCFPRNQCRKQQGADGNGMNFMYGMVDTYIPSTIVPTEAQKAVCELAITADSGLLTPDISMEDQNTILEKIGPITTEYNHTSTRLAYNLFRRAAMLMQPFVYSSGGNIRMVRS